MGLLQRDPGDWRDQQFHPSDLLGVALIGLVALLFVTAARRFERVGRFEREHPAMFSFAIWVVAFIAIALVTRAPR